MAKASYSTIMSYMTQSEPVRAVPPPGRTKYGWERFAVGDWYLVRSCPDPRVTMGHERLNQRIRVAAHQWGGRRGLRVETRSADGGGRYYLRFVKPVISRG